MTAGDERKHSRRSDKRLTDTTVASNSAAFLLGGKQPAPPPTGPPGALPASPTTSMAGSGGSVEPGAWDFLSPKPGQAAPRGPRGAPPPPPGTPPKNRQRGSGGSRAGAHSPQ